MSRVGQNRIYTPYMTVCIVISLPKVPYTHRINLKMYGSGQPYAWEQCVYWTTSKSCQKKHQHIVSKTYWFANLPTCVVKHAPTILLRWLWHGSKMLPKDGWCWRGQVRVAKLWVGLATTVPVHRIWPYIWPFPCQTIPYIHRMYMVLANSTHACAPAHTLHSYSHHPHPQPYLGECTLLLLGLRSVQHLEVGMEVHGLAFCGGSGGALRGAAGAAAVRGRGQEPVCACVCMWVYVYVSLWIYLWLAETSQQPISQTTWLKVTPNCNHCNHC